MCYICLLISTNLHVLLHYNTSTLIQFFSYSEYKNLRYYLYNLKFFPLQRNIVRRLLVSRFQKRKNSEDFRVNFGEQPCWSCVQQDLLFLSAKRKAEPTVTVRISRWLVFDLLLSPEGKSERFQKKILRRPCLNSRTSCRSSAVPKGTFRNWTGLCSIFTFTLENDSPTQYWPEGKNSVRID